MAGGNGGRPSKRTPEILAAILKSIEIGCSVETACGAAGINKSTAYDWMRDDPSFYDAVTRARSKGVNDKIQTLHDFIADGSENSAQFWLQRRCKEFRQYKPADSQFLDEIVDRLVERLADKTKGEVGERRELVSALLKGLADSKGEGASNPSTNGNGKAKSNGNGKNGNGKNGAS